MDDEQITMEEFEIYLVALLTPWPGLAPEIQPPPHCPEKEITSSEINQSWSCEKRTTAWNCYMRLQNRGFMRNLSQIIEARASKPSKD